MSKISESPSTTINELNSNRSVENILGSPFVKRKVFMGKEYSIYADGSILVSDSSLMEYHFLTKEGIMKGRDLRRQVGKIIKDDVLRFRLKGLGEGFFSTVYQINTSAGPIALKCTDSIRFKEKEKAGIFSSVEEVEVDRLGAVVNNKKILKMSLADTLRKMKELERGNVNVPDYFGFTVKRNPADHSIQEFQVMEKIDKPTVQDIERIINLIDSSSSGVDYSDKPFWGFLNDLAERFYDGNNRRLFDDIINSCNTFVAEVKTKFPNTGDLYMDNIFFLGYDEKQRKLEFMLIDPFIEEVYIEQSE